MPGLVDGAVEVIAGDGATTTLKWLTSRERPQYQQPFISTLKPVAGAKDLIPHEWQQEANPLQSVLTRHVSLWLTAV